MDKGKENGELEEKSLQELYERRKNTTNFSTGDELATDSVKIFEERKEDIRRFLDEGEGKDD